MKNFEVSIYSLSLVAIVYFCVKETVVYATVSNANSVNKINITEAKEIKCNANHYSRISANFIKLQAFKSWTVVKIKPTKTLENTPINDQDDEQLFCSPLTFNHKSCGKMSITWQKGPNDEYPYKKTMAYSRKQEKYGYTYEYTTTMERVTRLSDYRAIFKEIPTENGKVTTIDANKTENTVFTMSDKMKNLIGKNVALVHDDPSFQIYQDCETTGATYIQVINDIANNSIQLERLLKNQIFDLLKEYGYNEEEFITVTPNIEKPVLKTGDDQQHANTNVLLTDDQYDTKNLSPLILKSVNIPERNLGSCYKPDSNPNDAKKEIVVV